METAALIVFVVFTTVHLYGSIRKNKKLRKLTKPFLLLSLLWYYLAATGNFRWTVVAALLFSWLGDVLLMGPGVKWFGYGGIAFMVSHFFFILSCLPDISGLNIWIIVLSEIFFLILVGFIFTRLKPHLPKSLFYPMALYLFINGNMNCFAFWRALSLQTTAGLISCIGAVLFFISDTCLFFVRFNKQSRQKTHFWVMLTYSLGELLIVVGLL